MTDETRVSSRLVKTSLPEKWFDTMWGGCANRQSALLLFQAGVQFSLIEIHKWKGGWDDPISRNEGEIARTRAEATRVASLAQAVRIQIGNEVETTYVAFRASRERARLFEQVYLAKGRELREIAEFNYNSGTTSILDLLEVNRTYRELQFAYSQALAAYLTGLHQLNSVVGLDVAR